MKEYKYQMHCHTTPCSRCGRITPDELAENLYKAGYSGCVLTNHFYNGNTGISRELTWNSFIKAYESDYVKCKKAAEGYDLDILFGIEEHIGNGKEIICYGITPEMLYGHSELKHNEIELWHNTLSSYGVVIIQAHPFRSRSNTPEPGVLPMNYIDGIEEFNFGNSTDENRLAEEYLKIHTSLIPLSGADAHLSHGLMRGGIVTSRRVDSSELLIDILRSREFSLIKE